MKKHLAFLLCLITLLSLFSCHANNNEPNTQSDENTESITVPKTEENPTKPDHKEDSVIDTVQNEQAKQAYGRAIRNEIKIYYPLINSPTPLESYFKQICGDQKGIPTRQALVDMDEDGIEELILAYEYFFIILHFENDKVYGTDLHLDAMGTIYTDGSFSWSNHDDIFGYECGISRISFANGIKKVEELCRTEGNSKFFIAGVQVTKEQYDDYFNTTERTPVTFTAFDTAFLDGNVLKAIEIASEYWGIKDGDFDSERGFRYRVICKRKIDEQWYEISLYRFVYNSYYEHLEMATVNIETKEIFITSYPDGKG